MTPQGSPDQPEVGPEPAVDSKQTQGGSVNQGSRHQVGDNRVGAPRLDRSDSDSHAFESLFSVVSVLKDRSDDGVRNLLEASLQRVSESLGADRTTLTVLAPNRETLEILDIGAPVFPGLVFRVGEGLAGRVVASGSSIVVRRYEAWSGKVAQDTGLPIIRSAMASPLWIGATLAGAISAHSTDPGHRFGPEDAHVLEHLAEIYAGALAGIGMYLRLRGAGGDERLLDQETEVLTTSLGQYSKLTEEVSPLIRSRAELIDIERRRIAQDMHDSVFQTITGTLFEIKAIEKEYAQDVVLVRELEHVRGLIHSLEREARQVIGDLRPTELIHQSLPEWASEQASELDSRYGISCHVTVIGRPQLKHRHVETMGLRIIREALHNARFHAEPSSIDLTIEYRDDGLSLNVVDDGVGFDPFTAASDPAHLGLRGMKYRAESVGGTLDLASGVGGSSVAADLPTQTV